MEGFSMQAKSALGLALIGFSWAFLQPQSFAQTAKPQPKKPATATPARLDADLSLSKIYIKVASSTRLGHDHGVVGQLQSGWVVLGTGGELVFAMKTLITDTPEARQYVGLKSTVKDSDQKKSTSNMLGPEVLNVQKYPLATFKIDSCEPADGQSPGGTGNYKVSGTFTLRGASRPLAFNARVEPTSDPSASRVSGVFAIKQTAYGITPYSALGGLVGIEDRLDIWGDFIMRASTTASKPSAPTVKR